MNNKRFVVSPETMRRLWVDQAMRMSFRPTQRAYGLTKIELFGIEVLVDVKMPDDVVAIIDEVGLRAIIHGGLTMSVGAVAEGLHEYEAYGWWAAREDKSAPIFPEEFIDPEVLLVGTKKTVGPFYKDMWKICTERIKEVANVHRPVVC